MKLPKFVALMLILGLSLQSAASPETIQGILTDAMEAPPSQSTRDPAVSTLGGEQNIDPFTVHPANRWDSAVAGSFEETLENGELSWKGLINDSASMNRWRGAGTVDDTIANRWRLNATADFETNETDWFTAVSNNYGADGLAWEEGAAEPGEAFSRGAAVILTHANGDLIATINGADTFSEINLDLDPFISNGETDLFDTIICRWKANEANLRLGFANGSQIGLDGAGVLVANQADIFQTDILVLDADWTGEQQNLRPNYLETAGEGNFDLNEVFTIEFIRLVGDDEWAGDFEIPLSGFNATTAEGTANITLNAYPWNSTHYIVRPTFTTDDGTNWRSWNIESDYQDFFQTRGFWGADGWDWVENVDEKLNGLIGFPSERVLNGIYIATAAAGAADDLVTQNNPNVLLDKTFNQFSAKMRSNDSTVTVQPIFGSIGIGFNFVGDAQTVGTAWNTLTWNLTGDAEWDANDDWQSWGWRIDESDGTLEGNEGIFIDYFRLTSTNVTTDLTFFEYEKYYRSELEYNVRKSELSYLLLDDLGDDLAETEIGAFKIANFFTEEELIPDGFLAEVGSIDYLFGARTAGANATIVWDYYEAEFSAFNWQKDPSLFSEVVDTWASEAPFSVHTVGAGAGGLVSTGYNLTVPEFDGASGRFVVEELTPNTLFRTSMLLSSVTTATGAVVEELNFTIHDEMIQIPNSDHVLTTKLDGVAQTDFITDSGTRLRSEVTFSIFFDKDLRKLIAQFQVVDETSTIRNVAFSTDVASGQSNEFVIVIDYVVIWAVAPNTGETHISLTEWNLLTRDIFGGIKLPLPDVDIPGGDAFFDILLAPLIGILNGILALPEALGRVVANAFTVVGNAITSAIASLGTTILGGLTALGTTITDALTTLGTTITNAVSAIGTQISNAVDAIGTTISNAVSAIGTQISNAVDAIGTVISSAISAMEAAIELALEAVEDAVDLVTTAVEAVTAAIIALAEQIITALVAAIEDLLDELLTLLGSIFAAVVTFIRAIEIQGVVVGDVLDVIFSYLGLFTATAATTLAFLIMIVTEWSLMFMVFLFLAILFFSIGSSNAPGEVFGNIFKAYSVNTMPFTVYGFNMHVPLAFWNLPFIAIVVLGIA